MLKIIGILIILTAGLFVYRWFKGVTRYYRIQVRDSLAAVSENPGIVSEEDFSSLPDPLIRYFRFTGIAGTQRVSHFKGKFQGRFKMDRNSDWAPVTAEQYSFLESGQRLFKMILTFKGLPIYGLHHFYQGDAFMTVKILDLFKVIHNQGEFMKKGETVTWFNDLCLFAPELFWMQM